MISAHTPCPLSRRRILHGALTATAALTVGSDPSIASGGDTPRVLRVKDTGYDSMMPGPALQVRRGEEVQVRVVNELTEPTAVHWHGVRLINTMDGAPPLTQAAIAPGDSFDYRFTAPDAGTFWYHPPRPVAHGPYGALIVAETEAINADRDATLIFATSGLGDDETITVNGVSTVDIEAGANERLRLRLINACVARILDLRITNLRAFVMAIDGEPAQPFVARNGRLSLGPGNRIDLFVDCAMTPGETASITLENAGISAQVARIVSDVSLSARAARPGDPAPLPSNALPERMDFSGALRLDAAIGRSAKDAASTALFKVKRGRTVMLGLSNITSSNAFIHLHGHSFRLLDTLDDGWKPFWLDTMPVAAQTTARVAFVADNPGRWLIEGLAPPTGAETWFEVA